MELKKNLPWFFNKAQHSEIYIKYRPTLTEALYQSIIEASPLTDNKDGKVRLAVDVGCGPGNSTLPLAPHFDRVIGVDMSESQIEMAKEIGKSFNNVSFVCSPAEELSFIADNTVDMITVSQALHWFDHTRFYNECLRILKPGGLMAAILMKTMEIRGYDEVNRLIEEHLNFLLEYFEDGLQYYMESYEPLYEEIEKKFVNVQKITPTVMTETKSLDFLVGYLSSWSGYQKYKTLHPNEPDVVEILKNKLITVVSKMNWGEMRTDEEALKVQLTYDIPVFIFLAYKEK